MIEFMAFMLGAIGGALIVFGVTMSVKSLTALLEFYRNRGGSDD